MTTKELYTKGAKIWVRHPTTVWETATVSDHYSGSVLQIVLDESQEKQQLTISSDNDLPPLRNPDILLGENDLTSLSYLHEPAVLHNLQVRFCQNKSIYTYCGIVLVAVNPYAELALYGQDSITAYRGHALGDLEPHIFAVAEEAYAKLEREARDQSIIVSGESGAGKTVSAKYAMRYFACVGGSDTETQVERKVLASSPIMEAVGNAKTTRNDNSSRFGKFIELRFNKHLHITGASMRTYLLEKSRVVFQANGERNYHIFYQLCSSRNEMDFLYLDHQDNFNYLSQGQSPDIQGVSDEGTFSETRTALTTLGFSNTEQLDMFRVWAAILHLGNIEFLVKDHGQESDASHISSSDVHLEHFCSLMGIESHIMKQWLCIRQIISMNDVIQKPMSHTEANNSRDALAKHIYAKLFEYVVRTINKTLESTGKTKQCIGVLDIYGFETFEINSFEQFCINYANEKLQQQFNKHVFKLEQQEYLKEGIAWKMIDFYDNQPCIDLIESRLGILDLLDEECKMPKGSDSSWTEKLYSKCSKHTHFNKPRFGTTAFAINHFADKVQYESYGFLEKNRDTVMEQQISVLKCSTNPLVVNLFVDEQSKKPAPRVKVKITSHSAGDTSNAKQNKKSVGSQFRESLGLLMSTLDATTPHYVRCIKPNDFKQAFTWEPSRAVQQLRACGVLETIRISAAGFPSRWCYIDFFARYRVLCHSKDINRMDMIATCKTILTKRITDSDKYQFGKTMIFFRAGQVAYLEKLRADQLSKCCIIMQSQMRAFVQRKKYLRLRRSILGIQQYGRGLLGRRRAVQLRQNRAAITIQRFVRGWLATRTFLKLKYAALGIQRYARGYLARQMYMRMLYNAKAILIQRHVRGWLARRWYKKTIHDIIICQSVVRRKLARRRFRVLKAEARSVEHVKTLNKGLENKIISLQQKIQELNKKNQAYNTILTENNDLKMKLGSLKNMEQEIKKLTIIMDEKEKKLHELNEKLQNEQDEKMQVVEERQQLASRYKEFEAKMNIENEMLKIQLSKVTEQAKTKEIGEEKSMQKKLEEERLQHNTESEQQHATYQKLLLEYHALESRAEGMQEQLARLTRLTHFTDSSQMMDDCQASSGSPSEDDYGYGSVRSTPAVQHTKLDSIDWKKSDQFNENFASGDTALILKLQQKLHTVELDRSRLLSRIEHLEKGNGDYNRFEDGLRSAELEIENEKLRNDLQILRQTVIEQNFNDLQKKEILEQFKACQEERDRRRDECLQLRSVLATQSTNLRSLGENYVTDDLSIVNEDGELIHAYESQKKIIRQLETELGIEKEQNEKGRKEIERHTAENERLEKLLQGNLGPAQTKMEAYMQYEITRLTTENLNLQESKDKLSDNFQKLKAQLQLLTKRLKDAGLGEYLQEQNSPSPAPVKEEIRLPLIKKKDREYLGMFEYKFEDENIIIKRLVTDLKPRVAVTLLPCLPAYIVFMCIRYTDMINNDVKVRSIIQLFITATRKTIKKHGENLDYRALWLANMLRLLHNLKQYSGDAAFQIKNTPKQNDQCLLNFDLSEHRQIISDICLWIYQEVIKYLQEKIQPLIIPAILEHEAISGLTGHKPAGMRGRSSSVSTDSSKNIFKAPEQLVAEMTTILKTLGYYGVDPEIIVQIFKQLFYFICGTSLNNLLLRKDLCHWSKGMQIRYNISHLETWTRDNKLEEAPILNTLQPIIQAAQLLQARKSDDDVQSVCDMCSQLTTQQICKILNLYTPADGYEEKVSIAFIRKIQEKLQKRNTLAEKDILLMDLKNTFPIKFPFNPSSIRLEDIEIPDILNLGVLSKI